MGLLEGLLAREGEFVGKNPNPVILNTVSDINTIRVQFFLSENEYLKIAKEYSKEAKNSSQGEREKTSDIQLILSDGSLYSKKEEK